MILYYTVLYLLSRMPVNLQKDLTVLVTWATVWQLSFNLKKCNILKISRSTNSSITFNYIAQGFSIPSVSQHPYLGVELTSNLSWNRHIQIITKKANQKLAFLMRNLRNCPQIVKEKVYKSLIRSHLEYASSVWDSYLSKDILELEKIQRRSSRWVKSCYSRTAGVVTNVT